MISGISAADNDSTLIVNRAVATEPRCFLKSSRISSIDFREKSGPPNGSARLPLTDLVSLPFDVSVLDLSAGLFAPCPPIHTPMPKATGIIRISGSCFIARSLPERRIEVTGIPFT